MLTSLGHDCRPPLLATSIDSWTIKKAKRQRIDAVKLWHWRRLLRVLGLQGDQTDSKGNQS